MGNNRGQKYPLQGVTDFNQVVIKLQLILMITICDYDEEKYDDDDDNFSTEFSTRAALRASRVKTRRRRRKKRYPTHFLTRHALVQSKIFF